ncbi:WbqC family protein [Acidovorax sp. NCPPB 3859]|uniref:WbqC family protein n=1 Tax=Paracidovorax avenae TaxID=80867 RepID=UPI000D21FCCA|nr:MULTISPECIES: WbqC family protein [Comamonadaceae]AVS81389.1 hypothetical protein C8237_10040 [Paracidovorax avenae]MDA8451833.1 WbqC family protein [Acidovorax sp. GBBC 3297]MDA8461279.1 WbqC family protein [Acidovorax sp. GBBC 3333]MDA8466312.1 WbqC family protein [Acidovorax sp. GBBC 3332]MDA8471347.1 WbqC family protein [Acidovorax sp. GBBC 3299]
MHTTAVIVQSNYLPWKGYFDLLRQADIFVLYDDVQYTRRDWRNRNVIKTPQGLHWLTVPVNSKGQYHQDIERITVSSSDWIERHWSTIAMSYGKSPGFFEYGEALRSMLHGCADCTLLSEINHRLIQGLAGLLDIDTPIARSSTYGKVPGKNENLIHLCQAVGATRYLSGPSASSYLDPTLFSRAGIDLSYMDYSGYPEYKQPHGPFNHFVSVIDLLMSTGRQAGKYLIREETARAP